MKLKVNAVRKYHGLETSGDKQIFITKHKAEFRDLAPKARTIGHMQSCFAHSMFEANTLNVNSVGSTSSWICQTIPQNT